jgi:hypothetical protein
MHRVRCCTGDKDARYAQAKPDCCLDVNAKGEQTSAHPFLFNPGNKSFAAGEEQGQYIGREPQVEQKYLSVHN